MLLWLGHAAFRISAEKRIYIDPLNVKKDSLPADIILISHSHDGHCSIGDIARIVTPSTVIVGGAASLERLRGTGAVLTEVCPGRSISIEGVAVDVVPAYGRGHAKEEDGLGFVVTASGQRIYHAGDTCRTPEMDGIRCTIALLPVSGGNVMDAGEAAQAAVQIRPGLAIPMHYGSRAGSIADARTFVSGVMLQGLRAKLLTPA